MHIKRLFLFITILNITFFTQTVFADSFYADKDFFKEKKCILQENEVPKEQFKKKLQALVSDVSQDQAKILEFFEGPYGFTGLILEGKEPNGKKIIAWATPGLDTLLVGELFDRSGEDLSQVAYKKLDVANMKIDVGPGAKIEQGMMSDDPDEVIEEGTSAETEEIAEDQSYSAGKELEDAKGILQFPDMESPDKVLHVFFSTSCPYCEELYGTTQKKSDFLKKEKVQVNWIPADKHAGDIIEDNSFDRISEYFGKPEPSSDSQTGSQNYFAAAQLNSNLGFPMLAWETKEGLESHVGAPVEKDFEKAIDIIKTGKN
ncbi:MAG: hypothetical protein ACOCYO_10455 [Bacteroidota bacterium]